MDAKLEAIEERISILDSVLGRMETENDGLSVVEGEVAKLAGLVAQYRDAQGDKKVVRRDFSGGKSRYFLKDGSVYVTHGSKYRYLYDARSKVITYEFANGQIERTFPCGLKEIRCTDGSIVIKTDANDYERLGG